MSASVRRLFVNVLKPFDFSCSLLFQRRISKNEKMHNLYLLNEIGKEYYSGTDDVKYKLLRKFAKVRQKETEEMLDGMKATYLFIRNHSMGDGWIYFNLMKDLLESEYDPESPALPVISRNSKRKLNFPMKSAKKKVTFSEIPHVIINQDQRQERRLLCPR
jgi:hypothetical protein